MSRDVIVPSRSGGVFVSETNLRQAIIGRPAVYLNESFATNITVVMSSGSLSFGGQQPTTTNNAIIAAASGVLALSGQQPTTNASQVVKPASGALALTPGATITNVSFFATPPAGSLQLTGRALTIRAFRPRRRTLIIMRAQSVLDLDFVHGTYEIAGTPGASAGVLPLWSFGRTTVGTAIDGAGVFHSYAINAPRPLDIGLLIEPTATNLMARSEPTLAQLASSAGTIANGAAPGDAPFAAANWLHVGAAAVTSAGYETPALATSTLYSLSAFVEMDDASAPNLSGSAVAGDLGLVIANSLATPFSTLHLAGAVYRLTAQATTGGSIANFSTGVVQYNTMSGKPFRVTGFQVEALGAPSSYFATAGAAATRGADVAAITVTPPPAFTLFVDADLDNLDGLARYLATWDDGTTNNYVTVIRYSDNACYVQVIAGGAVQFNRSVAGKTGARRLKAAVSFDGATWRGAVDGGALTQVAGTRPVLTSLRVGAIYTGTGGYLQGRVRRIQALNVALATVDMQALTA